MAEEVKLFGAWGSAFSLRVDIALKLKGINYEYHEEDLFNKSSLLIKYNPIHKKVPVLVHHDKPLAESQVILEYIDETWENYPILPKDPYERAKARFWARFIDDKCFPAIWKAYWSKDEREKAVEELIELLKFLENELDDNFFGGETVGLVDIVGNIIAHWLPALHEVAGVEILTEEKFPKLCRWSHEFVNHSVVKEVLPSREKLIAFLRDRLESRSS
ncbi:putative glutathione S-transferase [Morus notabilis]|uniref:glutathione transferase n=1 Tax=Morus notabilis TaxID=981085 RepID=W9RGX0_9ROSA|nr:probable glutathione S-transferase [Morus notabilis]EXB90010.1 putative glutathione S-transferase [Morus notabilis]